METEIKDLELLSKYLSEEELKEVAKNVAASKMSLYFDAKNQNRKSNLEYYIQQGALLSVEECLSDFDKKELVSLLKEKTIENIKSLQIYHLPNSYEQIAKDVIKENEQIIKDKMNLLISNFVNGSEWDSMYNRFTKDLGDIFGDLLYSMLEKNFKKEWNEK